MTDQPKAAAPRAPNETLTPVAVRHQSLTVPDNAPRFDIASRSVKACER